MRIEVLGPVRVEAGGAELTLGGPQQRLVFGLLVAAEGRVVTTDQLVDRVWGKELPGRAREAIQVHVSTLRKALGDPAAIETAGGGYRLKAGIELDVTEFEGLVDEGRERLVQQPVRAAGILRRALGLWRGPAYADLRDAEALQGEIRRLEEFRAAVVEDRLEADIAAGEAAAAVAELEVLVAEHSYRERLRALLMTALYRTGRQTEALATYREFREALAEESGLDPSPELQDLELRILQQDPSLGPALQQPIGPGVAIALPARYSSFVGRDREVAATLGRLETNRLVTLVGPGGIGKSSLAIEALRLGEQSMVARFVRVDVEAAGEGDLELSLALAMGLQPGPSSDPEAVIIGYAQQRPHVLLFDGCESHIDEAAGVADRLLVSCPQMRIVATSREPLGLAGETTVRVGSLDTDEARRLFCERAGLDATGLDETSAEQVATVCTALDGVPLAIELAAARLGSMPLPRLVELLDDQVDLLRRSRTFDPRHGSLAGALEWSFQLLDEQQQRAFRMLAVFRSGFEIGAASVVIDDQHGADIIDRLVEVSLIQPPDARGLYRMLEPIRQYARFVLDQSGEEDEARDRHARWIAERCNEIFEAEWTPQIFEGHAWVVVNRFELAAALQWSIQAAKPDIGISILASVGRRLANQGHGSLVLPFALDIINHQAATPSRELAVAMAHTTHILHLALDHDAARALINRAETLATELDDPIALGTVLARKAAHLGEAKGGPRLEHLDMILHGMSLLEQAAGSAPIEYHNTSVMAANLGDIGLAEKYAHKLLAWEKTHHGPTTADADSLLGGVSLLRGDLDQAIEHWRKAASGHKALLVQDRGHWVRLARLLTYADRYEEAVEALDTAVELGDVFGQDLTDLAAPRMRVAFAAGDMNAVMTHAREWFGWALRTEGPLRQVVPDLSALLRGGPVAESEFLAVLLPLAQALMARGDTEPACRFARAASALMAQTAFGAWDEIGETERWEQLADQCPQGEHDEPVQMSLEQAFHEAARLMGVETPLSSP